MSEESKNPGMEMNDAALDAVSGGDSAWDVAKTMCSVCDKPYHCSHKERDLWLYIQKNGTIAYPQACPYYKL